MSSFTMTLEEVIGMEGEANIGLSDYPIFDEAHRPILNKKIIDHYYNQEIGQETISMFRLAMKRKMNEIMPPFNQNYILSQIELEALITADMKITSDNAAVSAANNSANTTSSSDATSRAVASQFPQNALKANSDYATSAQDNISKSEAVADSTDTQSGTQTNTGESLTRGFQGHQPELIFAARQTIVNLDLEIVLLLNTIFMGVWSTAAEYTTVRTHYDFPRYW